MAFCGKCGNQLAEGTRFCSGCGASQQQEMDAAPSVTTTQAAQCQSATMRKITMVPETSKDVSAEYTPAMKRAVIVVFASVAVSIAVMILGTAVLQNFTVALLGVGVLIVAYIYYKAVRKKSGIADQTLAIAQKKLNELTSKQPLLMQYFGVPNVACILPVPDTMFGRKLASLLPADMDKGSLSLHQYEGLQYTHAEVVKGNYTSELTKSGTVGLFIDPREILVSYYEPSALKKYIFRAIANMETTLGLNGGDNYPTIIKNLNDFVVVAQNENATIYLTDDDFIDLSLVKQELFQICNVLGVKSLSNNKVLWMNANNFAPNDDGEGEHEQAEVR